MMQDTACNLVHETNCESALKSIIIFSICGLALIGIGSSVGLYADGVHYFIRVLARRDFVTYPARESVHVATQLPLLLSLHLGVIDKDDLARVYSFGLVAVPVSLWLFALLKTFRTQLFWICVYLFALVYLNSGIFAVSESVTAYATVVASMSILIWARITLADSLLLFLFSILSLRAYELTALLQLMLSLCCLVRAFGLSSNPQWSMRAVSKTIVAFAGLMHFTAFVSAVHFLAHPTSSVNKASAFEAGISLLGSQTFLLVIFSILVILAVFFTLSPSWQIGLAFSSLCLAAFYLSHEAFRIQYGSFFGMRGPLLLPMSVLLLAVTLQTCFPGRFPVKDFRLKSKPLSVFFIIIFLAMTGLNFARSAYYFDGFIDEYRTALASSHGKIYIEDTPIYANPTFKQYVWAWNNPLMSLALGDSSSIIMNARDYSGFDPNALQYIESGQLLRYR
jgi:hypothetical protein